MPVRHIYAGQAYQSARNNARVPVDRRAAPVGRPAAGRAGIDVADRDRVVD